MGSFLRGSVLGVHRASLARGQGRGLESRGLSSGRSRAGGGAGPGAAAACMVAVRRWSVEMSSSAACSSGRPMPWAMRAGTCASSGRIERPRSPSVTVTTRSSVLRRSRRTRSVCSIRRSNGESGARVEQEVVAEDDTVWSPSIQRVTSTRYCVGHPQGSSRERYAWVVARDAAYSEKHTISSVTACSECCTQQRCAQPSCGWSREESHLHGADGRHGAGPHRASRPPRHRPEPRAGQPAATAPDPSSARPTPRTPGGGVAVSPRGRARGTRPPRTPPPGCRR